MTKKFKDIPIGAWCVVMSSAFISHYAVVKISASEIVWDFLDGSEYFLGVSYVHGENWVVVDWFEEENCTRIDAAYGMEPDCKCHSPQVHEDACAWLVWKRSL
jgi:hypothetical protein